MCRLGWCLALVAVLGCKKPPPPAPSGFSEAKHAYEVLVAASGDDAYADPEMARVQQQLARVPAGHADSLAARELGDTIASERTRVAEEAEQHRRLMAAATGKPAEPAPAAPSAAAAEPAAAAPAAGGPGFHELWPAPENSVWGFIDVTGAFVIPPRFSSGRAFSEGLAAVREKNSRGWAFIDSSGTVVIPGPFEVVSMSGFSEGYAAVGAGEREWFFIDRTGKRVSEEAFMSLSDVKDGVALAKRTYAPKVPEPEYRWVTPRGEAAFSMQIPGCNGVVGGDGMSDHYRRRGEPVLRVTCEVVPGIPHGRIERTWGYLAADRKSWLIAPGKGAGGHFTEGRASAAGGMIDRTGRVVSKQGFSMPGFVAGVALAYESPKQQIAIDREGTTLWKFPAGAECFTRVGTSFVCVLPAGLAFFDGQGKQLALHERPLFLFKPSESVCGGLLPLMPFVVAVDDKGRPKVTQIAWLDEAGRKVYSFSAQ